MTELRRPLEWLPRAQALPAVAVAASGAAGTQLLQALARLDPLPALEGVVSANEVVVLGPFDALPWVEGAVYLGREPEAPTLLLPTTLKPAVPLPWLASAVVALCPVGRVAVLPQSRRIVPLHAARLIESHTLRAALLGGEGGAP